MNEVWVRTPKGTVTKATRVTMWNSMIVTTISTARITKAIRMPMAATRAIRIDVDVGEELDRSRRDLLDVVHQGGDHLDPRHDDLGGRGR